MRRELTAKDFRGELQQKERVTEIKTARRIIEMIEKRGGDSYLYCPDKALIRCKDLIDSIKEEIIRR